MNYWIPFLILFVILLLTSLGHMRGSNPEGFIACDSGPPSTPLDYGRLPFKNLPIDRDLMRNYWGPYLWGWPGRTFYEYGPETHAPYPYQLECDEYANQMCHSGNRLWTCDPYCY